MREFFAALASLALLGLAFPSERASAIPLRDLIADTTFTVNTEDDTDDGTCDIAHCSLREALNAANLNAGTDTIAFSIPGALPHEIQPVLALPVITDPLVIDGTTEPDFVSGSPIVVLNGVNAGAGVSGLQITAGGSTVRALTVHSFSDDIWLNGGTGNLIEGSVIGTDFRALQCRGSTGAGIRVTGSNNTIGGTVPEASNVITCAATDGVYISGGSGNAVLGNVIGTNPTRDTELPNGRDGVRIDDSSDNIIGGSGVWDPNFIQNNDGAGIAIVGAGSAGNQITGNIITENAGDGVILPDAGGGNAIAANSILANGGLGIDLGADGVTPNDPGDADSGPNDLQNFPVLTAAWRGTTLYVQGTLDSRPGQDYSLEFFSSTDCNASAHGEGENFLLARTVTTDANGAGTFEFTIDEFFLPGEMITVTTTNAGGSTSEFSACEPVTEFALTLSPDSVMVNQGSSANYSVDIDPIGGSFNGEIALSCSDLPGLTTCSFSSDTVVPGASRARSIVTVSTTFSSSTAALVSGERPTRGTTWPSWLGLGLPVAGLLGLAVTGRVGRRRALAFPMVLGLAVAGLLVYTGCGDNDSTGPTNGGTPTGRHEFTVTGTVGPLSESDNSLLIVR